MAPHVTIFSERSLKECPSADFIVCGEGEHTFVDLVTVPFPGTKLYEDAMAGCYGEFCKSATWDDYNPFNRDKPPFILKGMSQEELVVLVKYAWNSYYLSPGIILRHLIKMRTKEDVHRYYLAFKGLFSSGINSTMIERS